MSNTERFRELCKKHGLKVGDVATQTGRSIYTVRHWMSGTRYPIPNDTLELLELKLTKELATNN